ncbi:hypothetical protein TNCV_3250341 [Trichonephila clavipes]|nr:hypothetical protein TNCV_3250341 [Trichonephila clavipes]
MRGSRNSDNVGRRGWNERRMSNDDSRWRNWRDAEVIHRPSDRRNNYRGNFGNVSGVREIGGPTAEIERIKIIEGLMLILEDISLEIGVRVEILVEGDRRNWSSSGNFSGRDRRQGGRLNILKVQNEQVDQSQSAEDIPIRLSVICMSPEVFQYVPILLNVCV